MSFNSTDNIDGVLVNTEAVQRIPTGFQMGKPIGTYMGSTIFDQITDNHGVTRYFQGVTTNANICKPGGIVARPGIIYEL